MTLELYLIRHGESEWNRSSRYTGQQDIPLSETGREQARRLAHRLVGVKFAAIYASPLRRARETAHILGSITQTRVTLEPGLAEIHHGQWEGLTPLQVAEKFGSDYARWRTQPHTVVMPQGESLADVMQRAEQSLRRILAEHPRGKIAVCSHDAVIRVLLLKTLGLSLEHFWKWSFENAALNILQCSGEGDRRTWRLLRLNDTTHLDGIYSDCALQAL
ncbi:MAG: histidine phosphatase family protein [Chloroflexi bacterium]|nr:histidine phosphatase family protein [Chloroflexota bacterium]